MVLFNFVLLVSAFIYLYDENSLLTTFNFISIIVPQYPNFHIYNDYNSENPNNWTNNNEDLPPYLMNIDLSSFDPNQLRPVPLPILNSNGTLNELDANIRMKNFHDYKQRSKLMDCLSSNINQNNNW